MSTKSTILLTSCSEHWYVQCNARYHEGTTSEYAIVLQIDKSHRIEIDEDGTEIIIEEDTPLYNEILKLFREKNNEKV